MASNSGRKSGSSDRSTSRRRVVITARQTSRIREDTAPSKPKPERRGSSAQQGSRAHKPAAVRVANAKRLERERRISVQRRTFRLRVALMLLAVVAVAGSGVAVYRSSLFTIETVEIVGASRLPRGEVLDMIALPDDATLLRYPAARIAESIGSSPWVAQVTVSRNYPDTLRVRIVEREPVALADTGAASFWLVDSSGFVIAEQTPDTTSTLMVVRDLEGLELSAGFPSDSAALENAIRVWRGIGPELRARTRAISAPSVDKTALLTTDDIEIFIGSADDLDKKDRVIRRILAEQAGKVVYVNVRTVDRPTWRGLDSP